MYYTARPQTNRVTGETVYVPAIVERESSVTLDQIIARCIDRGLIMAIKKNAAKQVAEAIALQMYEEFKSGRGVKFGTYFYARMYLDGTTDANGRLVAGRNGVNVRFTNGEDFKLALSDFTWQNVKGDEVPKGEFLISDMDGAVRGQLQSGVSILFNGVNFYKEGDLGTKVSIYAVVDDVVSDTPTAEVTTFAGKGPNLLEFAYPAGLPAGARYLFVPSRSADGENWIIGIGKQADVLGE